ncbi:MAG TPA: LysM peptidoglycan-binding domain-containing protein [Ignavibacteriales bacterium]|nr:LysM peptidoglycan-binding domain-containing protein [Ignavibacteriales bacterium]
MEFFEKTERAISLLDNLTGQAEAARTDEFDTFDYSGYIEQLKELKRNVLRFQAAYKFLKLDKEDFIQGIDRTGKVIVIHTVKDFETPLSIAKKYTTDLGEILILNDVKVEDIKAGRELKIVVNNESLSQVYDTIPTYGSQKGLEVLGRDLPNDLQADETGDLLVLGPIETLTQGVNNRISTKKGAYPLEENFGLSNIQKLEFPEDITNAMLMVGLSEELEEDARLSRIDSIEITSDRKAKEVLVQARTITNNMLRVNN